MSDITRSEAIKHLKDLDDIVGLDAYGRKAITIDIEDIKAIRFAIASLETDEAYQLEYEQPEFCEDCISRKEIIERCNIVISHGLADKEGMHPISAETLLKEPLSMPSVLPKATKNDLGVDAVSRQKAITWAEYYSYVYDVKTANESIMGMLRDLPSVTPQEPRWIPVSERLPEDRREVLVTAYWHETYQVMMALYYGDGLWWCVPFNNCGEHMQRLKPKAWMPLPKAYKAESEVV